MFKRLVTFFVVIVIVFSFSVSVIAESTNIYTDSVTGVSFTIPQGWNEAPLSEDREFIKVAYSPENEDGGTILFGYADVWEEMPDSDKVGYSRSDINHSELMDNFTKEEILQLMGFDNLDAEIDTVHYSGTEYLEISVDKEMSVFDISADITMTMLLHFENGYCYQFYFGDLAEKNHYQEFVTMMNSVKYPYVADTSDDVIYINSDGNLQINFLNIILSLIITISVYSLPIIIYRYKIKKQALPKNKAKKITIIYAIIAFFVMFFLKGGVAPGSAIFLWSITNYKILINKSKNDIGFKYDISTDEIYQELIAEENNIKDVKINENEFENNENFIGGFKVNIIEETIPKNETIAQLEEIKEIKSNYEQPIIEKKVEIKSSPKVLFCRKCGTRLLDDSDFCHKCGLRVVKEDIR